MAVRGGYPHTPPGPAFGRLRRSAMPLARRLVAVVLEETASVPSATVASGSVLSTAALQRVAMRLNPKALWTHRSLPKAFRKGLVYAVERRGMRRSETAHSFDVSLSSANRYVGKSRQGKPLSTGKAPSKLPIIDQRARCTPQ